MQDSAAAVEGLLALRLRLGPRCARPSPPLSEEDHSLLMMKNPPCAEAAPVPPEARDDSAAVVEGLLARLRFGPRCARPSPPPSEEDLTHRREGTSLSGGRPVPPEAMQDSAAAVEGLLALRLRLGPRCARPSPPLSEEDPSLWIMKNRSLSGGRPRPPDARDDSAAAVEGPSVLRPRSIAPLDGMAYNASLIRYRRPCRRSSSPPTPTN